MSGSDRRKVGSDPTYPNVGFHRKGTRVTCGLRSTMLAIVVAFVASLAFAQPPASETRILDRFDDVAAWKAVASDGVTASITRVVDAKRAGPRAFDVRD